MERKRLIAPIRCIPLSTAQKTGFSRPKREPFLKVSLHCSKIALKTLYTQLPCLWWRHKVMAFRGMNADWIDIFSKGRFAFSLWFKQVNIILSIFENILLIFATSHINHGENYKLVNNGKNSNRAWSQKRCKHKSKLLKHHLVKL